MVELAKEDFKFSAAHFTLFGEDLDEPLHGHNYRVAVRIEGERLDERGLLVDFAAAKKAIRELCGRLDDHTLLPAEASSLSFQDQEGSLHVRSGRRHYVLPADEVVLLPLVNTSVELLAHWLWRELAPELAGTLARTLQVTVGETAGQKASYSAPLS